MPTNDELKQIAHENISITQTPEDMWELITNFAMNHNGYLNRPGWINYTAAMENGSQKAILHFSQATRFERPLLESTPMTVLTHLKKLRRWIIYIYLEVWLP